MSVAKAYRRRGRSRPFLQFGLPLVTLTVVGFLGIGHLHQGRRDIAAVVDEQGWEKIKDSEGLTWEGPIGQNMYRKNKKMNLEEELKVMQEKMDINSFEYKKIPKPEVKE
eukprot:c18589_g1_i1 orf=348-677(-)